MKSFLLITSLIIAASIACSAYRSTGSPTPGLSSNATPANLSAVNDKGPTQDIAKCTLTLASIPAMSGLKPGMTTEEVLAVFPGSKEDPALRADLSAPPSQLGTSSFLIKPLKYATAEKFTGISQITFTFLDGRVSNFTIGYSGPEYSHVDKFVEKVVDGTNLPAPDLWEAYAGLDTQMKTLTCKDFEIRVFAGGEGGNLNYVLVKDLAAEKTLRDRRKKAREKATPTP